MLKAVTSIRRLQSATKCCLWTLSLPCRKKSSFKEQSHAIPIFLGNKTVIDLLECDRYNHNWSFANNRCLLDWTRTDFESYSAFIINPTSGHHKDLPPHRLLASLHSPAIANGPFTRPSRLWSVNHDHRIHLRLPRLRRQAPYST